MSSSKLTKNDLKDIVKECLIEILSEGILPKRTKKLSESYSSDNMSKRKKLTSANTDNIKYGKSETFINSRPKINTSITSDPILNEILADTANSTLQEQLLHESRKPAVSTINGDAASKIVAENNIEDIFGDEISSKWSQLAFLNQK